MIAKFQELGWICWIFNLNTYNFCKNDIYHWLLLEISQFPSTVTCFGKYLDNSFCQRQHFELQRSSLKRTRPIYIINILELQQINSFLWLLQSNRSRSMDIFCKIDTFENFVKFTGKHLCRNLFLHKVVSWKPATLLKSKLRHIYFRVNYVKFLRTPFS